MAVNDLLFDSGVRHAVFVQRYAGGISNRVIKLLSTAERDVEARLKARYAKLGPLARQQLGQGLGTTRRLEMLLNDLRGALNDAFLQAGRQTRRELRDLAKFEVDLADRRLVEAVGFDLNNFRPADELIEAAVTGARIRGRTLGQWFTNWRRQSLLRVDSAVQLGVVEGDSTPQIVRRVRQQFQVNRNTADMLVRTSTNQVSNQAREIFYEANDDLVKAERFTATLDGRTSPQCRAADGRVSPVGEGQRPPLHPRCRSILTPVLKSWDEIGRQGLKPGRGARDIDTLFQRNMKRFGFSDAQIAQARRNRRAALNGTVPADTTYGPWLKRQPASFQNEVLGRTKAKLFREGGLPIDAFVDRRTGREFTIDELRAKHEEAWMKAGLDE